MRRLPVSRKKSSRSNVLIENDLRIEVHRGRSGRDRPIAIDAAGLAPERERCLSLSLDDTVDRAALWADQTGWGRVLRC